MSIQSKSPGLRRYLYEYFFHQGVEQAKQRIVAEQGGPGIMVSSARAMRAQLDDRLAERGVSMGDPDLKVSVVLGSIEDVLSANIEDHEPVFAELSTKDATYSRLTTRFIGMTGLGSAGNTPGTGGPRLPISPYDPRFSQRSTVKGVGSNLLMVPEEEITQVAGSVARVDTTYTEDMVLYTQDPDSGDLREAGLAMSVDDISGMTELMGYMSEQDYADVRDWVIAGARTGEGGMDPSRFMSREALSRSQAILADLAEQGVGYRIVRDERPGQIKALIEGTKISVRLTDRRENENFVGRVYEDGAFTHFGTTRWLKDEQKNMPYTPTAEEAVQLLHLAQGKPVPRKDGNGFVGQVGTHEGIVQRDRRRVRGLAHDTYLSSSKIMMVYGDLEGDQPGTDSGDSIMVIKNIHNRTPSARFFNPAEESGRSAAEEFLRESVDTARENFGTALDVDRLVAEAADHAEEYREGTFAPEFSSDATVAAIQRSYWDVLTGVDKTLLKPGATQEVLDERVGMVGEQGLEQLMAELEYRGQSPEEIVRSHAEDVIDATIGTYDLNLVAGDISGQAHRFDPVHVAQYMTSSYGTWRNNDDMVAAMRALDLDPDELMGSNFYNTTIKDRLIRFDEASAKGLDDVEDPFLRDMLSTVQESLQNNGIADVEVRLDDQGVIDWKGARFTRQSAMDDSGRVEISGQIGQVFAPGQYGAVTTAFAGGDNYLFVPGYEAGIAVQKPGENKSVEERTILRGYDQVMKDALQYRISSDLMSGRTILGGPTSVNGTYRRVRDIRHEVDFIERSAEEGLSEDWRRAILETEGRRVRYSNAVRNGSTINEEYRASRSFSPRDPANDNHFDAWTLTGGRNMSILTEEGDGYFDPMVTAGSVNQGITRYLVEGAQVGDDGRITPGDADDRTPLMKHPDAATMRFNPFDRQQMTASNLMHAAAVTKPVGTALMTFGGWTADDPMVISSDFAREHQIRGADGQLRDLVVGDKLSDLHGNKGVISLIIDRQMSPEDAFAAGLSTETAWFQANPHLDVVMSPFSAVSRFNGGTARELMAGVERDPDGSMLRVPGAEAQDSYGTLQAMSGSIYVDREIVTGLTARGTSSDRVLARGEVEAATERLDVATERGVTEATIENAASARDAAKAALVYRFGPVFDDLAASEHFAENAVSLRGVSMGSFEFLRRASQESLGIPSSSKAASFRGLNPGAILETIESADESYIQAQSSHQGAVGEMQFIVTHMAVDAKTRIYGDEDISAGRGRKASSQLAWALGSQGCEKIMAEAYGTNNTASENFREMLVTMGLDMEPDGTLRDGQDDLAEGTERRLFEMPELALTTSGSLDNRKMRAQFGDLIGTRGGDLELPFPIRFPTKKRIPTATDHSWRLPVMSSHLRSGQELEDGSSTAHDYTNHYVAIFDQANAYRFAEQKLAEGGLTQAKQRQYETMKREAPARAQSAFNLITDNLKARKFSGKHNVFKEGLMSNRLSHSATAVWTSDPRLNINEVSMGPAMAESLGVVPGEEVLIWRDPMLRDAGVRALNVVIDDRLTGVAINPVMDKCFDGDFDGDSVAVVKLHTQAAKQEAHEKLSVAANLLDLGIKDEGGFYPLAMQDSLDTKVAQHRRPGLTETFEDLTIRANDIHADVESGEMSPEYALEANQALVAELSAYYRDALSTEYAGAVLSFSDPQSHLQSVKEACIDTGAKGSMGKLHSYARYLGCEMDDEGRVVDLHEPQATRAEQEGVMYATAVKSFGTGVAGKFSQRGVKAFRNDALKAVLELTYPATQSILQSKHDPEEARIKYENLMGPARALWRGRQLEKSVGDDGRTIWGPARDAKNREIQADPEVWKQQFIELYTAKDGLNVSINTDNVAIVAEAMVDPATKKMMDIEDPQNQRGSTMDRLAYDGTFEDLMNAAQAHENIFDGEQNGHFAPFVVQKNQKAIAEYEAAIDADVHAQIDLPDLVPLVKKDVQTNGAARGSGKRSRHAVVTSGPGSASDLSKTVESDSEGYSL